MKDRRMEVLKATGKEQKRCDIARKSRSWPASVGVTVYYRRRYDGCRGHKCGQCAAGLWGLNLYNC